MSVVRFLHTDSLRLGSPVTGLSDSPEWLRRISASAVRQSVINLVDLAIASRCQFVLVAGKVTESPEDLDPAVTWLKTQSQRLSRNGISLVIAGHNSDDFQVLSRLNTVLVASGQCLLAGTGSGLAPNLCVADEVPQRGGNLLRIDVGARGRPSGGMSYVAVPGLQASSQLLTSGGTVVAHDQYLRLTAGPLQGINPSERGPCGCIVVEADFSSQKQVARFCATDVLRFIQELVPCTPGTRLSGLLQILRNRSLNLAGSRGITVAEWIVDGAFLADQEDCQSMFEADLLRDLRGSLNAGHTGAWPCRIRFSERSQLDVHGGLSLLFRELAGVLQERRSRTSVSENVFGEVRGVAHRHGSELVDALNVLRRVA